MKEISIVIPVYNSQGNLIELARQVHDALAEMSYELILVNDGSKDRSWEIIVQLCRQNHHVIGVNLRKNSGQDNAIMAGLSYATGNYTVIMDDDIQHSPYDIIKLYDECRIGYDVCYANFLKKNQALWKNMGSWFNGKIADVLIDKPKHIYLSPFQIIRKEVVEEVLKYKGPYPYVQGLLLQITNNVTQITIEHHERYQGKGSFNFFRSLSVFFKLATSFSVYPLRIASLLGFLVASIGFVLALFYLLEYFLTDHAVEGWLTLVLINLIIGGLVLASIGLIGEYMGRMYLSLNFKPQYTVKETVRFNETE
ncbi:MAG: glycosyltransferase [Deltaproteobacteria bacterium]|nr:glycosyltransferase [Deltaproteobacteria bacterium]